MIHDAKSGRVQLRIDCLACLSQLDELTCLTIRIWTTLGAHDLEACYN